MSKRFDITDGTFATTKKNGLIYTEELGWIDLGHAQGDDARFLKKKLEQEQWAKYYNEFNDWYFPVNYYQEMGNGKREKFIWGKLYFSYWCTYSSYGSCLSFSGA